MTEPSTGTIGVPASTPPSPGAQPEHADRLPATTRLAIGLLVTSAFVVILNETIMSVALPRLMVDLDITASTAQWLTTGFLLTMAVVIPATGFILQRFHMRPVFITAMALFSVGTLVAALAPGFGTLLLGRVVQASGTAVMMPLLMTTVLNSVPPHRRGAMMGTISIVMAVAPAIGPTVSGLVLSVLDWRWMFWIVLPIALVALLLGVVWIRNLTTPRATPFDVLSIILSAVAFGGLIFGLSSMGEAAEGDAIVPLWIPLVAGVVALAGFIARQLVLQRTDRALLDLRTFLSPAFVLAIVIVVVSMSALFGSLIVLPLYLQNVLGLDTLATGLLLLPGGVVMAILSPVVGRLFDRVGPRPLVVPGAIVVTAALWGMTLLHADTPVWLVVVVQCTLNAGLGFLFTPLLTSALGSLPSDLYAHGSAIVGTVQQLAGAAGTALFITLMATGTATATANGVGGVDATAAGIQLAFFVGALISLVALAVSFFVRRPVDPVPQHVAIH